MFEIPRKGNAYEEVDEQPKKGEEKEEIKREKFRLGDVMYMRNIGDLREDHLSTKCMKWEYILTIAAKKVVIRIEPGRCMDL